MADIPSRIAPHLSTLVHSPPEGDEWIHEIKHDGYRLLARREGGRIQLFTRNGHDWTSRFTAIVNSIRCLPADGLWLDGELVVMVSGRSCFGSLQEAVHRRDQQCLAFWVFDVMFAGGRDIRPEPLEARKKLLREILPEDQWNLRYVDFIRGHGLEFFRRVCQLGLEGIISKKIDSCYLEGRNREWLKVKNRNYNEVRTGNWEIFNRKRRL